MSLAPRLDLRQSQQLVMTPQLQQAIKLLTLTNLELEGFIAAELEKNPLLEAARGEGDGDGASGDVGTDPPEPGAHEPSFDAEPQGTDQLISAGRGETDAPLDVDYAAETFHHDGPSDAGMGLDGSLGLNGAASGSGIDPAGDELESVRVGEVTLAEHLANQAAAELSGFELTIAAHIIDLIDDAGYFIGTTLEIAERLGRRVAEVERVLKVIQTFEPTGVGARTLGECLALQAREADRLDPAMARMLNNLELVARGDMAALRRICGVDAEDLADMIQELRGYNPKPGLQYGSSDASTVVPDIFVARTAGGWAVELNQATLPKVLVNRSYYTELGRGSAGRETRSFLSDCLASANWLVKALDQRARTFVKVSTELVRQQEAFFDRGVHHLRPLNLRTIAEAIGMHESTVSRVTANKYLACERGLFELRYFFTSAIQSADGGEAHSASTVKQRIKALISAESLDEVLSDDRLVELLNAEGFDIARRTVAKYREAMNIGSSVQRRRRLKLAS